MTLTQLMKMMMWIVILLGAGGLIFLASATGTQAQGNPLPTPTDITNGGDHTKDGKVKDGRRSGAYLELHVSGAPSGAWSVVQWQDSAGGWHNVDGWVSSLDARGSQRWWVAAKDFGQGPFRWVVIQKPGNMELGVSEPFSLPTGANETVHINLV